IVSTASWRRRADNATRRPAAPRPRRSRRRGRRMDAVTQNSNDKSPKILIADDDPSVISYLAKRCRKLGLDVQTAAHGLSALLMARRDPPDVLIVDVNMPELDGLTLSVRLLDPKEKPLQVIVMTGNSNPDVVERCDSVGAIFAQKGPELWNTVQSELIEL